MYSLYILLGKQVKIDITNCYCQNIDGESGLVYYQQSRIYM